MFLTALALIAAAPVAAPAPTAAAPAPSGYGAITANYHADRAVYCIRSGWSSASFATNRSVRAGDCRTAEEWRRRGIAFDATAALEARRTARAATQVAAR